MKDSLVFRVSVTHIFTTETRRAGAGPEIWLIWLFPYRRCGGVEGAEELAASLDILAAETIGERNNGRRSISVAAFSCRPFTLCLSMGGEHH